MGDSETPLFVISSPSGNETERQQRPPSLLSATRRKEEEETSFQQRSVSPSPNRKDFLSNPPRSPRRAPSPFEEKLQQQLQQQLQEKRIQQGEGIDENEEKQEQEKEQEKESNSSPELLPPSTPFKKRSISPSPSRPQTFLSNRSPRSSPPPQLPNEEDHPLSPPLPPRPEPTMEEESNQQPASRTTSVPIKFERVNAFLSEDGRSSSIPSKMGREGGPPGLRAVPALLIGLVTVVAGGHLSSEVSTVKKTVKFSQEDTTEMLKTKVFDAVRNMGGQWGDIEFWEMAVEKNKIPEGENVASFLMEKCPTLMEAAVPRIPLTFSKKILNKRHLIARELYETEKTYVNNLQKTILSYLNPNEDVLPPLFLKMKILVGVNKVLLQSLEERLTNWTEESKIGDTIVVMAPYFAMYLDYAGTFSEALKEIERLLAENNQLAANFAKAKMDTGDDFPSFAIQPIQRIPRYELLLRDIMKETPETHPDFQECTKALEKIKECSGKINEHVRHLEESDSFVSIASKTSGRDDLLAPHRKVVKQAVLWEMTKGKKQLVLLLNDGIFVAHQESLCTGMKYVFDQFWDLELTWVEESQARLSLSEEQAKKIDNVPNFKIHHPGGIYWFAFSTDKDRNEWWDAISDGVDQRLIALNQEPGQKRFIQQKIDGRRKQRYSGQWDKGNREGEGKQEYFNNLTYQGSWEGDKERRGILTFNNKDGKNEIIKYRGGFRDGKPSSKKAKIEWENGDVYKGEIKGGECHGKGTLIWKEGGEFDGSWEEGLMVKGKLTNKNGDVYEGAFEGGLKASVKGFMKYADGGEYFGGWVDGFEDGEGTYTYPSKTVFKGTFKKGQKIQGALIIPSSLNSFLPSPSKCVYEGDFEGDLPHGMGVLKVGNVGYSGAWRGGMLEGKVFTLVVKEGGKGVTMHQNCIGFPGFLMEDGNDI